MWYYVPGPESIVYCHAVKHKAVYNEAKIMVLLKANVFYLVTL